MRIGKVGAEGATAAFLRRTVFSFFLSSAVHFAFFSPTRCIVLVSSVSLPGCLDKVISDVVGGSACPIHSLLLEWYFASRLQRATEPNTRSMDMEV